MAGGNARVLHRELNHDVVEHALHQRARSQSCLRSRSGSQTTLSSFVIGPVRRTEPVCMSIMISPGCGSGVEPSTPRDLRRSSSRPYSTLYSMAVESHSSWGHLLSRSTDARSSVNSRWAALIALGGMHREGANDGLRHRDAQLATVLLADADLPIRFLHD